MLENPSDSLINKKLIKNLDSQDKQKVMDSLTEIINISYKLEFDFHELKEFYHKFIEILPQAVWVLESEGEIFYQNSKTHEFAGVFSIIKSRLFVADVKIGQSYESELEYKDNAYLFKINYLKDKIIVTATDITKQKRQERLASMGQVSAHLAHEIRNPVGSISLLTSSLLKSNELQTQNIAIEIKKSIWRIERLINATLLFSKGMNTILKKVKLKMFKDELETCISYYTYLKNIDFIFSPSFDSEHEVMLDFDLFSIVLQNFVFNAIDAIEENDKEYGVIEIDFLHKRGENIFSISDNGKHIEDKTILFEAFKTTKLKGNGLGLALSKQIIQAHNGKIELEEHKNKKVFVIKIPQ